jgi:hypothetical protein
MHKSIAHTKPTYEVACAAKGLTPLTLDMFSFLPENQRQAAFSLHRVETVCEYLKQGKEFDWNGTNQPKYYPWWDMETYGDGRENDGFVLFNVDSDYDCTDVSARLCSFSREDAQYLATEFREDYKNFMK